MLNSCVIGVSVYNNVAMTKCFMSRLLAYTPDVEIIVVDDCSNDGTAEYISELQDPRITLIKQPRNRGTSASRNEVLKRADGRSVLHIENDLIVTPGWFEEMINSPFDITCSNSIFESLEMWGIDYSFFSVKDARQLYNSYKTKYYPTKDYEGLLSYYYANYSSLNHLADKIKTFHGEESYRAGGIWCACTYVKSSVIDKIGYYDESMRIYWFDVEYVFRAQSASFSTGIALKSINHHFGSATLGSNPKSVLKSQKQLALDKRAFDRIQGG